jgi:RHS repeat-associated protein
MRYVICTVVIVVVAVSFASPAFAQNDQTGVPAFSSQSGGVNLGNLNTHMTIPVVRKNGRGIGLSLSVGFDSTIYNVAPASGQTPAAFGIAPGFGWNIGTFGLPFAVTGQISSITQPCPGNPNNTALKSVTYMDTLGTGHSLPASALVNTDPNCAPAQVSGFADDQSGYFMTLKTDGTAIVQDPSGNTINIGTLSTSITDRNGNLLSADGSTGVTDTLGVTALTNSVTFDSNMNITSITYTFPAPNGASDSVVLNYKSYPKVASGFGCANTTEATAFGGLHFAQTLMDNIVLPDGSKYSFQYEPTPTSSPAWVAGAITGRVQSVTLPTGATVSYTYPGPNGGINCADGTTIGLTRTTSDGTTTYSRSVSTTTQTTTVTDPQGNQTVVSFVPVTNPQAPPPTNSNLTNWIETQRQAYRGSSAGGALLQTTIQCYNDHKSNCNSTPVAMPINEISTFLLLANGKENERDTFVDSTTGLATEIDEYDFGSGAPGPLLRKSVTTYAPLGNNIINRPASTAVCSPSGTDAACNGSGTKVSQSTFNYDQGSVTATSGITHHVAVSGSRGNLTSSHRWLNTNNTTLDTINTFDDTGNVLTTTDPGGHTTSFTYGGCNGTFATQTTLPDTNSPSLAHHSTSATYDCTTGLPSTSTDQNGNVTKFFYDNMLRPIEVDFPDLGKIVTSYPDPNHVTVQKKIDGSRSTSSTTVLDGYGRASRTATANGESTPYDQQDSCYDSNGRLSFRSYPYQGNAPNAIAACPNTSLAGDIFAYDALGRPTKVTHSDGSFSATSYAGLASQIADEGNGSVSVSRILQKDGLGRLTSVCELYSGAALLGSGGAPASCGLDIGGSGFLTTYGYDTLGNMLTVTQGALTNRTYAYDSLSRRISDTTPEAGTVSYTYNADSLLATRVRPTANQTNSAVTTTTNYQYDPLHRPIGRTYSGDPANTPAPTFNYDESSVWGMSLSNTIGRMTSETVGSPLIAKQIFSYDPIGRPLLNAQCTPQTCSATPFAPYSLSYQYDLLGNVTSAGNGVSVAFSNSYNIAGRFTGMTSSWNDANHPSVLLTGAHYSPSLVTDILGNGVAETANFSTRGQLQSQQALLPGGQPATASVPISGALQSIVGAGSTVGFPATRIQSSGGSSNIKYFFSVGGPSQNGVRYSFNVTVRNQGSAAVKLAGNFVDGPVIQPGATQSVSFTGLGDGVDIAQLLFETLNVGDAMDVIAFAPAIAKVSDGVNLIPTASQNFSAGWSAFSGAAVTVTQGQIVPATRIQSSGGSSNIKYFFSVGSPSQNGVRYSFNVTVQNQGSAAVKLAGNFVDGPVIQPGITQSVNFSGLGDGVDIAQLLFETLNPGDAMDVIAFAPAIAKATDGINLIPAASQNFTSGWSAWSGAAVTLTQGRTDLGTSDVIYDAGTAALTIGGFTATACFGPSTSPACVGQTQNNSANAVATSLSSALNTPASPASATVSGATLTLTWKESGPFTVAVTALSASHDQANLFPSPSFTSLPANFSGGSSGAPAYSYSLGLAPDGQVTAANDLVNGNWAFGYDQFNRLANSNKNSSQQTFNYQYDRYGNRWQQNAPQGGPAAQYLFDNNNRLNGSGVTYDVLGHVMTDGLGNSFAWDAEGRLIQVKQGSTVTATYSYDAAGRRVHGPIGEYVYDLNGRMITQIGLNGVWAIGEIYAGSRHLATYSAGTTNFYHGDWLGTKRVMTAVNGTTSETCTGFAFGDGVNCTGTNPTLNGFTDDIHDSETNLEHTLNRKYSSAQGRWLTPDPAGTGSANPTNPQSWNRYAYVMNNATNVTDPLGLTGDSGNGEGVGLSCEFDINCNYVVPGTLSVAGFMGLYGLCGIENFSCGVFGASFSADLYEAEMAYRSMADAALAGGDDDDDGGDSGIESESFIDGKKGKGKPSPSHYADPQKEACSQAKQRFRDVEAAHKERAEKMAGDFFGDLAAGAVIGCGVGFLGTEAVTTTGGGAVGGPPGAVIGAVGGTPLAVGNCAVGAIGGGVTAYGVYILNPAHWGDMAGAVSDSVEEMKAIADIAIACSK